MISCKVCRFSAEQKAPNGVATLQCRINPPTWQTLLVPTNLGQRSSKHSGWPDTTDDGSCGQGEPISEVAPLLEPPLPVKEVE